MSFFISYLVAPQTYCVLRSQRFYNHTHGAGQDWSLISLLSLRYNLQQCGEGNQLRTHTCDLSVFTIKNNCKFLYKDPYVVRTGSMIQGTLCGFLCHFTNTVDWQEKQFSWDNLTAFRQEWRKRKDNAQCPRWRWMNEWMEQSVLPGSWPVWGRELGITKHDSCYVSDAFLAAL